MKFIKTIVGSILVFMFVIFVTISLSSMTKPNDSHLVSESLPGKVVTEQVQIGEMTYIVFILINTGAGPHGIGVTNLTLDEIELELMKKEIN